MNFLHLISDVNSIEFVELLSYNPFRLIGSTRGIILNFTSSTITSGMVRDIFDVKFKRMDRYPVRVYMSEYYAEAKPVYDANGTLRRYEYLDGEVLYLLGQCLNFQALFVPNNDTHFYGLRFPNGSLTGAMALAESGGIDIAANTRIINPFGVSSMTFLRPIGYVELAYAVPKRTPVRASLHVSILSSFDVNTRIIFILTVSCFFIFWLILL